MTTVPTPQPKETQTDELDRLRAQRDRIARIYGHQPKQATVTTSPRCVGHTVPLRKAVTRG